MIIEHKLNWIENTDSSLLIAGLGYGLVILIYVVVFGGIVYAIE